MFSAVRVGTAVDALRHPQQCTNGLLHNRFTMDVDEARAVPLNY